MSTVKISHGRGGAANIVPDDTPYTDGEIVREGAVGDQGDGVYSAGRGGTGNIGGQSIGATGGGAPHDADVVPEIATRLAKEESHHVGRGGAGNEHHHHEKKADQHGFDKTGTGEKTSLLEKAKHLFSGKKE